MIIYYNSTGTSLKYKYYEFLLTNEPHLSMHVSLGRGK